MLDQILAALFPDRPHSRAIRRAWTVALLLFPLALIAGFLLLVRNSPPAPVRVTADRDKAIEIARAFLVRQKIPATAWPVSVNTNDDNNLLGFVNARPERIRLWNVAPPFSATVVFRKTSGNESVRVTISADGKVLGFDWKNPPNNSATLTDAAALSLARAYVPTAIPFDKPSIETNPSERIFTFRSSAIPEALVRTSITVRGDQVVTVKTNAEPDESAGGSSDENLQTGLTILGAIFLCAVALFSLYRYASRTLQQEISHRRSLIVALLCGCFCVLLGLNAVINSNAGNVPTVIILVVFAILGVMGGGLLAAAYGSGEGDIREAFPGRLTSLDALLTGHIVSRNVGISVLFGMTIAAWLSVALGLAATPFRTTHALGTQNMNAPFLRLGWLMPLVTYPLMSLGFAAAGLLQPLAFLQRYAPGKKRWHLPALLLCAGLVSMLRSHSRSTTEFLLTSAAFVLALLLPFFRLDFLASLVCVSTLLSQVAGAAAYTALPGWDSLAVALHTGITLGALLLGMLCLWRGRMFTEEEVRPLYASHIAQRKALEAEVSAAREAQLRLLPDAVPDIAGLHISAACLPAETVGGDFYDFFPLGDGRLGVFLAEGNNRGLAAALTIALAKGYLMKCVERYHDPVEILTRLEIALASIFERNSPADSREASAGASADFVFAAIDTAAGEIRYARTSAYPKVVVVSPNSAPVAERMVQVRGRLAPIAEGRAPLAPGDHIVLFTDGLGRRLAAGNRRPEEAAAVLVSQALQRDTSLDSNTAGVVRDWFLSATQDCVEPDDLTLVVIRMQAFAELQGEAELGVVA